VRNHYFNDVLYTDQRRYTNHSWPDCQIGRVGHRRSFGRPATTNQNDIHLISKRKLLSGFLRLVQKYENYASGQRNENTTLKTLWSKYKLLQRDPCDALYWEMVCEGARAGVGFPRPPHAGIHPALTTHLLMTALGHSLGCWSYEWALCNRKIILRKMLQNRIDK